MLTRDLFVVANLVKYVKYCSTAFVESLDSEIPAIFASPEIPGLSTRNPEIVWIEKFPN